MNLQSVITIFLKRNSKILLTILLVKCSIVIISLLAFFLFPFGTKYYYPNFTFPFREKISVQTAFKTWDGQHYLYISEKGYHRDDDSNAFSPLFPFFISLGKIITKNSFWSGMLLSNILSFAGFYLFYVMVKNIFGEKIAYRSLLALLAFPTSFYFSLIYTESLFLFLITLFFLSLQKKNLLAASVIAFFLPLTRLIGVAIIVPFLVSFLLEYHKHSVYDQIVDIGKTLLNKKTIFLISPLLGLVVAMGIMYVSTGDLFAQFAAQQNYISHYSFFSLLNPLFFFRELFAFPLVLHGFTNSFIDRLFFILFICFLPFVFKRVSVSFFAYSVVFGFLPVLSGSFMSYMRYLVVIFPLFITLGTMSTEKKYQSLAFGILFFSLTLQSLFLTLHCLNYWVA